MSEKEGEWVICETCGGMNKIRLGTCYTCDGTGVFEGASCPIENCEYGTLVEPCPDRPECHYGKKFRVWGQRDY